MGFLRNNSGNRGIDVPMSAMIDVVFLLLIFFIVTYKEEIPEAHLQVNLPQKSEVYTPKPLPELLEIQIHPGQYVLEGRALTLPRLHRYLEKIAAHDPTVVIKVNQRARTKHLVGVLDICKDVNLTSLNVVALK